VVWVTGAGGLIGHQVAIAAQTPSRHQVAGLTRGDLDLLDSRAVERRFLATSPALVIHCAAISTAGACASHPELARQVNVDVTRRLAELCAEVPFIFLSTDLVFDGRRGNYVETDAVNPLNLYAETKAEAEQCVLANPRHFVIRTSLNAGISPTGDRSFLEQTRRAWEEGKTLKLFTDEFRSPIGAAVTARAIWALASTVPLPPPDATASRGPIHARATNTGTNLFHVAGTERLNRLQIGELLAEQWPDLDCRMEPASLRDFPGPPRAADCSLNCSKAQSLLPFPLPRFSDWLQAGELAKA